MPDPLSAPSTVRATEPEQAVAEVREAFDRLRSQIARVIVGQDEVVEQLLIAMFCRGHALVVGVPGLAKTLLISTIARSISLGFSRIQFTPDLMPSDITGTEVIEEDRSTGAREMRFVKGPIFANVILADEINRTPPKTQAALLEAMQEHQVTVGGMQHKLPEPFFVLATQNPIEQEGTYPLPVAQLDRFMFNVKIGYPTEDEEVEIMRRTTSAALPHAEPVLTAADVARVQELVRETPVADHVIRYALRLVRSTRTGGERDEAAGERAGSIGGAGGAGGTRSGPEVFPFSGRGEARARELLAPVPKIVRDYLAWGAGPRAGQYLILAAKAKAILGGSFHVTPDHIRAVAHPVLRHRIITNFNAEADGVTTDTVITRLLREIPVEGLDAADKKKMDSVMR